MIQTDTMKTNRQRIGDAMKHIAELVGEEESIRVFAKHVPSSPRYDITAAFAERIAWAVSMRFLLEARANRYEDELDASDLLDTQRSAVA